MMPRLNDYEQIFQNLKDLAARPQGVTAKEMEELEDVSPNSVRLRLQALRAEGKLFKMSYGIWTSYFLNPEAADLRRIALIQQAKDSKAARIKKKNDARPPKARMSKKNFYLVSPKELAAAQFRDLVAVIPDNVKITRALPFVDRRYYVEDTPMLGGFLTEWQDLRRHA